MLFKYSDFADEEIIDDISDEYCYQKSQNQEVSTTHIKLLHDHNRFNQEKGDYITIEISKLFSNNGYHNAIDALKETLSKLTYDEKYHRIMIVGLGNQELISDALGPMVVSKMHLIDNEKQKLVLLSPGVMGKTGIESYDHIQAITAFYKPDLLIVIDALATLNWQRINKVIQINNIGIMPGSGIGNFRKPITKKNLGIEVISIGVASVISIDAILRAYGINKNDKVLQQYVMLRTMDQSLQYLSDIIASALQNFLTTL